VSRGLVGSALGGVVVVLLLGLLVLLVFPGVVGFGSKPARVEADFGMGTSTTAAPDVITTRSPVTAPPTTTTTTVPVCRPHGKMVLEFLNDAMEVMYTKETPLAIWYVQNGPTFRYIHLKVTVQCAGGMPSVSGWIRLYHDGKVVASSDIHDVGSDTYEALMDVYMINAGAGEYTAVAHVEVSVDGKVLVTKELRVNVHGEPPPEQEKPKPQPVKPIGYTLGPWGCCSGCCGNDWSPSRTVWIHVLYTDGSTHDWGQEFCPGTAKFCMTEHVHGVKKYCITVNVGQPPSDIVAKCNGLRTSLPQHPKG